MKKLYIVKNDPDIREKLIEYAKNQLMENGNSVLFYPPESNNYSRNLNEHILNTQKLAEAIGKQTGNIALSLGENMPYAAVRGTYYLSFWRYLGQLIDGNYAAIWVFLPEEIFANIEKGIEFFKIGFEISFPVVSEENVVHFEFSETALESSLLKLSVPNAVPTARERTRFRKRVPVEKVHEVFKKAK